MSNRKRALDAYATSRSVDAPDDVYYLQRAHFHALLDIADAIREASTLDDDDGRADYDEHSREIEKEEY